MQVGTAGNDVLRGAGGDILAGGTGNDVYHVSSAKGAIPTVRELAGGGTDTVYSYVGNYTLPANVENLVLGAASRFGGGNALDNVLRATGADQTLAGGGGNDVLHGNVGTTFAFAAGGGADRILGWNGGDTIRLEGLGLHDFADVRKSMRQIGADTVLDFGVSGSLTLAGVRAGTLKAENFQLSLDPARLVQTFGEEFDRLSLYDATTRTGIWRTEYGWGGGGTLQSRTLASNAELQLYMDAAYKGTGDRPLGVNPFSVTDGILDIAARPTAPAIAPFIGGYSYTSGLLTSKPSFSQEYGYFEVRAKLPAVAGFWPAFWLLPADGSWPPELDVFETLGQDSGTVHVSAIGPRAGGGRELDTALVHVDTTQWHTYGADWGPTSIGYYIDGTEVARLATPAAMQGKEMYMLLNLAVGGWAGTPQAGARADMLVDYVRAYATPDTVSMTVNGVAMPVPRRPAPPSAQDDSFTTAWGTPLEIATATLLANDSGAGPLAITAAGNARNGTLLRTGDKLVFTPDAGFSGLASFTYETTGAGGTDTATVSVTVGARPVAKTNYLAGTADADFIDKSASDAGWHINGGGGADTLIGGKGANALNGAGGNDILRGAAGNDLITGGAGADTMAGGGGADIFVFNAGDLVAARSGKVDRILDFSAATGAEHDLLRFQGFGPGATLSLTRAFADGSAEYHVSAGANSGDLVIHSQGTLLGAGDYLFL